jgi:hypothetical protein
MLGMKQDLLASIMGDDWTQIKVSRLEAREEIEDEILDEEAAISIVANTFTDEAVAYIENYKCTFNPLDKWAEEITEKSEAI